MIPGPAYVILQILLCTLRFVEPVFNHVADADHADNVASIRDQHMTKDMTALIIKLLASNVDFQAQLRPTDSLEAFFSVADSAGQATEDSELLYVNARFGDTQTRFYRFQDPDDGTVDYFDENGKSIRQFLLRNPVPNGIFKSGFGMTTCAKMVRPGGLIFVATINRTMKAAALAIFAAENILRWLPRGTHQYEKLVRPEELEKPLAANGLEITDRTGVFFNPLSNQWNLSKDMDVNYMLLAKRPA